MSLRAMSQLAMSQLAMSQLAMTTLFHLKELSHVFEVSSVPVSISVSRNWDSGIWSGPIFARQCPICGLLMRKYSTGPIASLPSEDEDIAPPRV